MQKYKKIMIAGYYLKNSQELPTAFSDIQKKIAELKRKQSGIFIPAVFDNTVFFLERSTWNP